MITKQESTPKIIRKKFLIKVGLVAVGLTLGATGLEACGEGATSTIGAIVSSPSSPTTQAKTASTSSGAVNPPETQNEMRKVTVEFDVFSGRSNPVWDLSSDAALEFLRLVTGLPPSNHPLVEGGLGYRGFIIHNPAKVVENLPKEVQVYRGVVRVTDGGQVKDYADTRQLEYWLEEQARQQGYSDIINQIRGSRSP